jgi:uncharacterized protein YqeY
MTVEILTQDMYAAMKAKDRFKKDTIASIIGAVQKTAIDRKCKDNITEALVDEVLLKELKTVKEMIDTCPADRVETRQEYENRYNIVSFYAPEQLSEADVKMELAAWATKTNIELIASNKAQIMRGFMPTIKGRADGKLANKVIMEALK